MKRAATVALALGAVIGAGLSPAAAQVVIGGSGEPDVQVNWSVLDRLGPAPNLADMLKADIPTTPMRMALSPSGAKPEAITFHPYAEPKKKVARKATPAVAKAEPAPKPSPAVAELAEAAEAARAEARPAPSQPAKPVEVAKAEPKAPVAPVRPAKPEIAEVAPMPAPVPAAPAPAVAAAPPGPKVSLPETPAPVAASATAVAIAKPENIKPETTKAELAKAEPEPTPPATVAPAAVAPAPAPAPQVASLPAPAPAPAPASSAGDTMSIPFTGEAARLPESARADLQRLAARMEKDEALGLQLLAYADGDEANASKARRLSLSRALEVRKFLMEQGVRSTRIEVRALGNKSDGGPADRVDAILVAR